MGWALSRPLTELAERLRGISQRKSHVRLGPQTLAELDEVAREFNQMAERLENYDRMNVERIVYEKSKTEAIIESLEDGVVLIDSDGIVAHINEVAALIMGIEPADALGSRFDDLSSNHPHYLRVRDVDSQPEQGRGASCSASRCNCTFVAAIILMCSSRCRCARRVARSAPCSSCRM